MRNFRTAALAATSLISLVLAAPAMAQSSDPAPAAQDEEREGEIVVTAQKRTERVIEVPISITVATPEQLERQQVNTIADLSRVAPSLEIQQAPGQSVGGGGQIRGIGTQSFNSGAVGSVGIVVDGVSQGNANISDLFDVGRIEVLKGPQGTLFGLTTSAGVINISTTAPDFTKFGFRARTELSDAGTAGSEYGRQIVQGLINVPLSSNAAFRLSGNLNKTQGVDRNAYTGKLDSHSTYGFRGRLLWEPSSDLTVNIIGDWTKVDDKGTDFFVLYRANPVVTAEAASCGITVGPANRSYCTRENPGQSKNITWGGSLEVDYDAGPVTLTSITAYRDQTSGPSSLNIFRLDPHMPHIIQGPGAAGNSGLWTQEFRASSPNGSQVEYTVGAFFSRQKTVNPPGPFQIHVHTPFGLIFPVNTPGNYTTVRDDSNAVFGQATFHATDQFRVIAGARYTSETLGVDFLSFNRAVSVKPRTEINNFSWKLGAQYEFDRDLISYATVSRGYKGPQIALGDPTTGAAPTIVRPEIPTSYELGLKAAFANGKVGLDANAFYTELKDYQGQLCITLVAGGLQCVPRNISGLVSKGAEVNLFGRPNDNLSLNVGAIWARVEYPSGFVGQDGTALGGEQLVSAPEWKFTASAEYSQPIGPVEGFIAADGVYKSEIRLYPSTVAAATYAGHATIGGRLGIRGDDGAWTVAVFARNLTNNHEPVYRLLNFPDGTGGVGQILTPQSFRQVGLSADIRF